MAICAEGSPINWIVNGAKIIFKCPVIDVLEVFIAIQAVQQFGNRHMHTLVYSVTMNSQPLLWVLLSLSLLGYRSHPGRRGGKMMQTSLKTTSCVWVNVREPVTQMISPKSPSDTYRNTWLSRGSRLSRFSWITLV